MQADSRASVPLVSEHQRTSFWERGFVLGGRLLTDAEADEIFALITDIVENEENPYHSRVYDFQHGGRPFLHIKNMWKRYPVFAELHHNRRLLGALQVLTGESSFHLWQDRFFYKPARSGSFHTWHQDGVYLPFLEPYTALSAWVALTDATTETGAMRMVPGSHRWGDSATALEEVAGFAADGRALPGTHNGHQVVEVDCPVPKGYVHFHHCATWHCSVPNWSDVPRCGLGMFFTTTAARFDGENRWAKDYEGQHGEPLSAEHYPLIEL